MAAIDQEALQSELKTIHICRFCLSQSYAKLTNIYMRDTRIKTSAPLPIQIMAIASIEIFRNDGMPCFVCSDCINIFEYSYQFKQMCKNADNLIRQYPLTGKWPKELEKPTLPILSQPSRTITKPTYSIQVNASHTSNNVGQRQESLILPKIINDAPVTALEPSLPVRPKIEKFDDYSITFLDKQQESLLLPKILNAAPVTAPEPSMPVHTKMEKLDDDCPITLLDKIENNDELSVDDIQQLVASEDVAETDFVNLSSVRKEAVRDNDLPKIKKDIDGNMEIVAEILNIDEHYENEPDQKNAEPKETDLFPCPHCERSFPLIQLRDIHLKKHTRGRNFQCEECDKCFFFKCDLQRHSFTHNGVKPFKCSACDKAFTRSCLLSRHEQSHTDIAKYICVHCERSFLSKEHMEKHAERHNIYRPFQCKLCNKFFAFKQSLERHEAIHSRQQPYSCQYCDLSFSTTTKLARHLIAHAGERPYPCKFCKKSYYLPHHLTRHLRSHKNVNHKSNVVPFMCSLCDASFESRDELIRHSSIHADEDNLKCPLCKECFESINALTGHIREHSDGEAYACEFCDLFFMTAEKLQIHTDTEHVKEMDAYHEDDRAQADKQKEAAQKHGLDVSDANLQSTINSFLIDDMSDDANETISSIKKKIKKEEEQQSPKIINQNIIPSAEDEGDNDENQDEDNSSLLIPIKQRKINSFTNKQKTLPQTTPSPQLRRKTPAAASGTSPKAPIRETDQPSIQSFLKLPKGPTVTKATPASSTSTEMSDLTVVKMESESPTSSSSTSNTAKESSSDAPVTKMIVGPKKVKVQKITITKAVAAAMAKDGRIKIKDGKIILNK